MYRHNLLHCSKTSTIVFPSQNITGGRLFFVSIFVFFFSAIKFRMYHNTNDRIKTQRGGADSGLMCHQHRQHRYFQLWKDRTNTCYAALTWSRSVNCGGLERQSPSILCTWRRNSEVEWVGLHETRRPSSVAFHVVCSANTLTHTCTHEHRKKHIYTIIIKQLSMYNSWN